MTRTWIAGGVMGFLGAILITVVLDVGHGFGDSGAVVEHNGRLVKEHELNLIAANAAKKALEEKGLYHVFLLQKRPYGLEASGSKLCFSDLVVSIHHNNFWNPEVNGSEVFYYDKKNRDMAAGFSRKIATGLQIKNRGAKLGNIAILRGIHGCTKAVLTEGYFMGSGDIKDHHKWSERYGLLLADAIHESLWKHNHKSL